MEDMINVPDDFDTMMVEEIEDTFYGGDLSRRRPNQADPVGIRNERGRSRGR